MNTEKVQNIQTGLDKLAALGTSDAIAWELEQHGIRGIRKSPFTCAVAQYLGNNPVSPNWLGAFVAVKNDRVLIHDGEQSNVTVVPVPEVVGEFINRFDRGEFPVITEAPTVAA